MKTNYLAVAVCAAAYWLLGGLWYGLLFGPRWMALENITIEQGKSMNSALPYVVTLVLDLLIAYVLAHCARGATRTPPDAVPPSECCCGSASSRRSPTQRTCMRCDRKSCLQLTSSIRW